MGRSLRLGVLHPGIYLVSIFITNVDTELFVFWKYTRMDFGHIGVALDRISVVPSSSKALVRKTIENFHWHVAWFGPDSIDTLCDLVFGSQTQ
jgi:hypothetical protein